MEIFPTNYLQILKAIVVVYTIKTGMSNIWQLSGGCLNPSKVEAAVLDLGQIRSCAS